MSKTLLLRLRPLRGRSLSSPLRLQPATRPATRARVLKGVDEDFGLCMHRQSKLLGNAHGESGWETCQLLFATFSVELNRVNRVMVTEAFWLRATALDADMKITSYTKYWNHFDSLCYCYYEYYGYINSSSINLKLICI